jgi:hypothetical protein
LTSCGLFGGRTGKGTPDAEASRRAEKERKKERKERKVTVGPDGQLCSAALSAACVSRAAEAVRRVLRLTKFSSSIVSNEFFRDNDAIRICFWRAFV